MKKRLRAYWWCQIGGWIFIAIANIIYGVFNPFSWSFHNISADIFFFRLIIISSSGFILTHLMRWVIIRLNILQKKFNHQIIYLLIITFMFTIVYAFSTLSMFKIFGLLGNNEMTFTFLSAMIGAIFYSFIVLFVWNLIYFIYHYVERVRKQQIYLLQRELLENELKRQKLESEKARSELQHKATELEMQALRAQMNPHFIFNSLNSINLFILQNNKAQASEYLTKFSKLVRLILQNSQAALIPLETELESLQLYLELEALRFDHHFEYKIKVENDLETDVIKVPPLIIQPYAENAIWHGLMHKEEKGHLEIELYQQDDLLCCRITDDGIGRKKAAALKSKSGSAHKSMGMRITAERIAILQQQKRTDTYFQITDLMLPDGSVEGTEVLLKIPIIE